MYAYAWQIYYTGQFQRIWLSMWPVEEYIQYISVAKPGSCVWSCKTLSSAEGASHLGGSGGRRGSRIFHTLVKILKI